MINWPYPFDYESLIPCTHFNCPERKMLRNRHHNYNLDKKRPRHLMEEPLMTALDVLKDDPELTELDHLTKMSPQLFQHKIRDDQVTISDDKFFIKCPISDDFSDEELTVRTLDDFIVLEGHHEDKSAHAHSSRSFSHKWSIPEGVQVDHLKCHLNPKTRELRLEAPRRLLSLEEKDKEIPIKFQNKKQKTSSESEMEKMLDMA